MTVSDSVPRHEPVAVVYYRYDEKAPAPDHVHKGLYYIHNGVALADLPLGSADPYSGAAFMSHVPEWSATGPRADRVWICDHDKAAKVSGAGQGKAAKDYMWSPIMDGTREVDPPRLWVWKFIRHYAGSNVSGTPQDARKHQPIAWVEDDLKSPHNGVFDSFDPPTNGSFTLHCYHWMNNHQKLALEDDRTATAPERFTLERRSLTGSNIPTGQVMVASQPPRSFWS